MAELPSSTAPAVGEVSQQVRILIVLMGSLGDVLRGLALVTLIKKQRPQAQLTWLVEPNCESIVRLHPEIDRVLVFQRRRGLRALPQLLAELRSQRYDITLDLQRHFKSGLFSWLSRAPRRIGFHRKDAKELNWLFNNEQIEYRSEAGPKLEHYLCFLLYLGLLPQAASIEDPALDFGFSTFPVAQHLPAALGQLTRPRCALVLGSSWPSKDWPSVGYVGLLKLLLREYPQLQFVLIGDARQKETAQSIVKQTAELAQRQGTELINLTAETSLLQLLAVIAASRLLIGPDSGPAHIAGAFGVRYVSLFGPTDPQRVAPYGNQDLVVQAQVGCAPCYRRECPGLGQICMRLLSPEMVLEKVRVGLG
jgi:heptosyltransferase-1